MAKKSLSILCLILVICLGLILTGCPKKVAKTDEGAVTSQQDQARQQQLDQERRAEEEKQRKAAEDARIKRDELKRAEAAAKAEEERKKAEEERKKAEEERKKAEEERKKAEEGARKEFEASLQQKKEPAGIQGAGEVRDSSLLKDVHFDFDKYDIRPADADIMKENASILMKNPNLKIQVEGHCDERGTVEYNLALGERRANSVRKYLVSLGVPADRLSVISYGKEMPLDPGHNEAAWAMNRRAHLTILSK